MISTTEFSDGVAIEMDGQLWTVVEFQHVKPGKGGAFVRTKLRRLRDASVIERTFRAGEKFQEAYIEKRSLQYLYRTADAFHAGGLIGIEPPMFVEVHVESTEPGVRGDTSKGGMKPATLETGATIQVPLFVNTGDLIRVETRTASYVSRV